jgi:CHAD domain-containing protein
MLAAIMSEPFSPDAAAPREEHPPVEVEWQFDAVDLRPVDRWLRSRLETPAAPGEPEVGPPTTALHIDLYADTDDWRLHRAGYVLRLRRKRGRVEATLKSQASSHDGLRTRTEITEPVRTLDLEAIRRGDGPVGWRVGAMSGAHPVTPVLTVRTRRTVFPLHLGGRPAGEVALDATTIPIEGGGEPVRLRRVEVEMDEAAQNRLRPFVDRLREACGLWPASQSKYEAGLLAAGLDPSQAEDLGSLEVDQAATVGEVAFAVLRTHFTELLSKEPGTRLGEDPEELHDMRVAARRLRAALALFVEVLPVRAGRYREELTWLAGVLGDVRDLDVQLQQLDEWERAIDPEDRRGLEALRAILDRRRTDARQTLAEALDSMRRDRLVAGFSTMLRHGPLRRSSASRMPVLLVAPDLLSSSYDRVRRGGKRIRGGSPADAYHRLRIRAKRLRYAIEFLSPVYGRPARALVRTLVAVQDVLGEHQDAQVAMARLRALVAENAVKLPPDAVFAMGRIAERYSARSAALRRKFAPAFGRLAAAWGDLARAMERKRSAMGTPPQHAVRGLPGARTTVRA